MLHLEISKLWSEGLIQLHSRSGVKFNHKSITMTKKGDSLKENDLVQLEIDQEGRECTDKHTWRVKNLVPFKSLNSEDLELNKIYWIYDRRNPTLLTKAKCVACSNRNEVATYTFDKILDNGTKSNHEIIARSDAFPAIYGEEKKHGLIEEIEFQLNEDGQDEGGVTHVIPFSDAKEKYFELDISQTNVVLATGKASVYNDVVKSTPEVNITTLFR